MNANQLLQAARKNATWLVVLGFAEILLGIIVIGSPLAGGLTVVMILGMSIFLGGVVRLVAAFAADSIGSRVLTIFWGIFIAAIGIYIFMNPAVGLATLTFILAMMLFASGVIETVVAFQMEQDSGWGWILAGGIISVVLAIMIWNQFPFSGMWLVGTIVGINLLVTGLTNVMVGSKARRLMAAV